MRVRLDGFFIILLSVLLSACTGSPTPTPPRPEPSVDVLTGTPTTSIDLSTYHLQTPDAEELLRILPDIVADMERTDESEYQQDTDVIRFLLSEEIKTRYGDLNDVPFDVLRDAEPYINRTEGYDSPYYSDREWHHYTFNAWLRETQPDLATSDVWDFRDYSLQIEKADFDGDQQDEFAVELSYQPNPDSSLPSYLEFFALQPDPAKPARYSLFGETVLLYSVHCPHLLGCNTDTENQGLQDLTGDGLPEWWFSRSGCVSGGVCTAGLRIFGWQDAAFSDLTEDARIFIRLPSAGGWPEAPPDTWILDNLDTDPAIEITQQEQLHLQCDFSVQRIFDWDQLVYGFEGAEAEYIYADSPWCALRQAHLAMKDLNFPSAIAHYEHMLTFAEEDPVEAWQYARLRLATAYALNGQSARASTLLENIHEEPPTSTLMDDMIENAYATFSESQSPIKLCRSLFMSIDSVDVYAVSEISDILSFGQINDYSVPLTYFGGDYGPYYSGCDVFGLWQKTGEQLIQDRPLDDQIMEAGWSIEGQFHLDLNDDGIDEWLVWPEGLPGWAVLRWSDGTMQHDTVITGRWSDLESTTQFAPTPLPDNVGTGIVRITFNPSLPCQRDVQHPSYIIVWRLTEDGLERAGGTAICAPQTVEQTFPVMGELRVLAGQPDAFGEPSHPYTMVWDSEQLSYVLPPAEIMPTPTLNVDATEDILSCYGYFYDFCGIGEGPSAAINMIDVVLENPPEDATPPFIQAFLYYRARLLEDMGRDDEALEGYVTVYRSAPDSAWGQIASLHIEIDS